MVIEAHPYNWTNQDSGSNGQPVDYNPQLAPSLQAGVGQMDMVRAAYPALPQGNTTEVVSNVGYAPLPGSEVVSNVAATTPQTWTYADGTVIQHNTDGSYTWTFTQGSIVSETVLVNSDGTVASGVWNYRDGTVISKQGNHSTWTYPANSQYPYSSIDSNNGTTTWNYRNGTVVTQNGNHWLQKNPPGSQVSQVEQLGDASNTIIWTYSDGRIVKQMGNYSVVTYPAGGQITSTENVGGASGTTLWHMADGTSIAQVNGQVTQYPAGTGVKLNSDGTISAMAAPPVPQYRPQMAPAPINEMAAPVPVQNNQVRASLTPTDNSQGLQYNNFPDGTKVGFNQQGQPVLVDNGQGGVAKFHYDQNGKIDWVYSMDGSTWRRLAKDQTGQDIWVNNRQQRWTGTVASVDANGNTYYQPASGARFIMTRFGQPQTMAA